MALYSLNDDLFQEEPEEASPSEFNTRNCGQFLEVSKDKLSVKYVGSGTHTNDVGAIQANRPAPTQRLLYYLEVAIRDRGEKGRISVGFTEKTFKMSRQPGWEPNSYGYHGDDGKFFNGNGSGESYGPTFSTNDMIGAGINYSTQEIFFTKNGKFLGVACKDVKGQLFPTIGLHSPRERVEANFGKRTFLFDIEALLREERDKRMHQVEGIVLPSSLSHSIVRDYFSFYGYQATLSAFDSTTGGAAVQQGEEKSGLSHEQQSEAYSALDNRKILRQLIRSGDIDAAFAKLHEWYPDIIQKDVAGVGFLLTCQKFIELIRKGSLDAAVTYGRQMPSGVQLQILNEDQKTHRQNCLALLAYEDPLHSPVSYLLGANQREAVADTVNAFILGSQDGLPQCVLEKLLRQLTACTGEKRAIEGGQGEVFRLHQVLNEHVVGPR